MDCVHIQPGCCGALVLKTGGGQGLGMLGGGWLRGVQRAGSFPPSLPFPPPAPVGEGKEEGPRIRHPPPSITTAPLPLPHPLRPLFLSGPPNTYRFRPLSFPGSPGGAFSAVRE